MAKKRKNLRNKFVLFFWGVGLFCLVSQRVLAGPQMYQRCGLGVDCQLGEYVFDDSGSVIDSQVCTMTIRNPSGTLVVDGVGMTASVDGWHSYTINIGSTEGLYRALMYCDDGDTTGYLDKSFMVGTDFDDIDEKVWQSGNRTLTSFGTLVADIWAYSTRNLTGFGTLVADIWDNSERKLTSRYTDEVTPVDLAQMADVSTISSKVDSLISNVGTMSTNVDVIVTKWGSSSAGEIVTYIDGVELVLGDGADECGTDDTVFGEIDCVTDKWGDRSATILYQIANDTYGVGSSIKSELGYSGKSRTVYEDAVALQAYVDTLETLIGESTDIGGTATIFGRIKKIQDEVDKLDTIDANIDTVLGKWGSYSATDIYDKVKDLASDISGISTVTNVALGLTLAQTSVAETKEMKNSLLAMKAVVDVNRLLLEQVDNKPVVKTWLEEGSVIFKTLATNPSKIISQTVTIRYDLPKEVKEEDVMKISEGLSLVYDESKDSFYVEGEFDLSKEESKVLEVEVVDIWKISEDELARIKKQAKDLGEPLKKTSYFAQASSLKSDIEVAISKIEQYQKEAVTPGQRIRIFRENQIEMEGVSKKMEALKMIAGEAGAIGTMFGFVGGIQTMASWGLVIVFVAGFVFLVIYMRQLMGKEMGKKEKLIKGKYKVFRKGAIGIFLVWFLTGMTGGLMGFGNRRKVKTEMAIEEVEETGEVAGIVSEEEETVSQRMKVVVPDGWGSVCVYDKPSFDSVKLVCIDKERQVEKIKKENSWCLVEMGEVKGWVLSELLENSDG